MFRKTYASNEFRNNNITQDGMYMISVHTYNSMSNILDMFEIYGRTVWLIRGS